MKLRLNRKDIDAFCAVRGISVEQVMQMVVSSEGDTITVDETHAAYPQANPGLGDMVASGLSAVGITKERVGRLVGGDCGCRERQEALNALGRRLGIGR